MKIKIYSERVGENPFMKKMEGDHYRVRLTCNKKTFSVFLNTSRALFKWEHASLGQQENMAHHNLKLFIFGNN